MPLLLWTPHSILKPNLVFTEVKPNLVFTEVKPNLVFTEVKPNKEIYLPHPQGLGIHGYSSTKKKDLGLRDWS